MKNESLTPNPSPKGEGSKMKNEEWGMLDEEPSARRSQCRMKNGVKKSAMRETLFVETFFIQKFAIS